ncbi:MAG: phytanoyl-CoA dioxygenase family protein [Halioglobus sp.]|nr:phytanoyl-CoA dioxygenase family protein [Halioglobus sp.]
MTASQELLQQAEQLVNAGDYRSAINLLESRGRYDDQRLAERLVELRIQAYDSLQWPKPHDQWPPDHDGRFDGLTGFPEIKAHDLDVGNLKAGILGRGGLIVRGLMSADWIAPMRVNIDRILQARMNAANEVSGKEDSAWYHRSASVVGGPTQFRGGERYSNIGSVWSVDSPPTAFKLIEFYREVGLPALLHDYFDEDAVLSVRKWVVRCAAPNNGASSGWHQDGYFLGDANAIRTVNLWIALTDCGGDAAAPGLEIIAGGERTIYETGTCGAPFDWTVGQGIIDDIAVTNPVQCPRFNAGDALFFDHFNLHRTGFGVDHSQNRYAVETWFFAGSTAPRKQQPVFF